MPYRYNCTHKNESYCQYTFLYKDDPSLGLMDVVMDKTSVLCPVIVKPDYLGWALGKHLYRTYNFFKFRHSISH